MQTHTVTTYSFNELSDEAKAHALDFARDNEYLGEHVVYEALYSLKGFCEHYGLNLDYSIGLHADRGEYITANIEDDEIKELSSVRLFKYLEKSARSTYISKYSGKVENILGGNCPFTGVCYDESLLDSIRAFMLAPDDRTFQELVNDCTSDFLKSIHSEGDYLTSDPALIEEIEANEQEFNQDGSTY